MNDAYFAGHLYLLAQQTSGAAVDSNTSEQTIPDKAGEVDVSVATIWETLDNMIDGFLDRLPFFVIGLVIIAVFFVVAGLVRKVIRNSTTGKQSANVGRVLGRVAQWSIILIGLIVGVAIMAPSITPARLLASLGVGGVAIGFAFKDIMQNFLAGLLILLREPFKVGDQIISGDHEGTVDAIETRATMIKTYDGRRVVIPNSQIYTNPVVVNTAFDSQRTQYDVGIGYGDDIRKATQAILDAVKGVDGVLSDPAPDVLTMALAGSTVNLRARWWTAPDRATVMNVQGRVITSIKVELDRAGIDMPYPTSVMLFHDQTETADGDRTKQREGWPAGNHPPGPRTIARALGHVDRNGSE